MWIALAALLIPVLLLLGGLPDHFLKDRHPTSLEDIFTVVWREQRGPGLSFHPGFWVSSQFARRSARRHL